MTNQSHEYDPTNDVMPNVGRTSGSLQIPPPLVKERTQPVQEETPAAEETVPEAAPAQEETPAAEEPVVTPEATTPEQPPAVEPALVEEAPIAISLQKGGPPVLPDTPHYTISRSDRLTVILCAFGALSIENARPTISALLNDYLIRRVTRLHWSPDTQEWLADGSRWVPTDDLGGFGPSSGQLSVLALTTAQAALLDRSQEYFIPMLLESESDSAGGR